jgi:Isocitrate lyase family
LCCACCDSVGTFHSLEFSAVVQTDVSISLVTLSRSFGGGALKGVMCESVRVGILIEDQLAPKSCGHVRDKQVVDRDEAVARIQAAVDAREEGSDILIVARTDARQVYRHSSFCPILADARVNASMHCLDDHRLKVCDTVVPYEVRSNSVVMEHVDNMDSKR